MEHIIICGQKMAVGSLPTEFLVGRKEKKGERFSVYSW